MYKFIIKIISWCQNTQFRHMFYFIIWMYIVLNWIKDFTYLEYVKVAPHKLYKKAIAAKAMIVYVLW